MTSTTSTDTAGCPVVTGAGVESTHRLTLGALETGTRQGETAVWVAVQGPLALTEIAQLVDDLQTIQGAAEEWADQQEISRLLDDVAALEERLADEALAAWMDATGATVAEHLHGVAGQPPRDARDIDEDEVRAMDPEHFGFVVSDLDEAVGVLEREARDNPLRPHPSSPDSDEQRDFRAAVGL